MFYSEILLTRDGNIGLFTYKTIFKTISVEQVVVAKNVNKEHNVHNYKRGFSIYLRRIVPQECVREIR